MAEHEELGEGFEAKLIFPERVPQPSCHAATVTELPNGDLYAAWYAGSREMGRDVAIYAARLPVGARDWSFPEEIASTPGLSEGNPVLFQEPNGPLWLYFVTIHGLHWRDAVLKRQCSEDGGRTWSPPRMLPASPGIMIRSKMHVLRSGEWLLPLYDEAQWTSMVWITADRGDTWTQHGHLRAPEGVIQPALAYRTDGSLLALLRPGGKGSHLWRSVSTDEGRTWSATAPTEEPNPNSGLDVVALRSGALLLANNPSRTARTPLTLSLSTDGGQQWRTVATIEPGRGEYSYPYLIRASDGTIHLLYTYLRTSIKHVSVKEETLR
ncbi:MAG TPA: sialidase family protein [Armatimonadota bacterium]|jgi:predicted neuraminidase